METISLSRLTWKYGFQRSPALSFLFLRKPNTTHSICLLSWLLLTIFLKNPTNRGQASHRSGVCETLYFLFTENWELKIAPLTSCSSCWFGLNSYWQSIPLCAALPSSYPSSHTIVAFLHEARLDWLDMIWDNLKIVYKEKHSFYYWS